MALASMRSTRRSLRQSQSRMPRAVRIVTGGHGRGRDHVLVAAEAQRTDLHAELTGDRADLGAGAADDERPASGRRPPSLAGVAATARRSPAPSQSTAGTESAQSLPDDERDLAGPRVPDRERQLPATAASSRPSGLRRRGAGSPRPGPSSAGEAAAEGVLQWPGRSATPGRRPRAPTPTGRPERGPPRESDPASPGRLAISAAASLAHVPHLDGGDQPVAGHQLVTVGREGDRAHPVAQVLGGQPDDFLQRVPRRRRRPEPCRPRCPWRAGASPGSRRPC